jgi:hypothetical protein
MAYSIALIRTDHETEMTSSDKFAGYMRTLIYPIIFVDDPMDRIDYVIETIVDRPAKSRADYIAAISAALKSSERLSELVSQVHSEAVIRDYLSAVQRRLEARA